MRTGFVHKILYLGHMGGIAPALNFFMILNKKYTRVKDEMILKMIVMPLPTIKKLSFREKKRIEGDVSFQM